MNLVFDKSTLKVVSLFDDDSFSGMDDSLLRSTFPTNFKNLALWEIKTKIKQNPIHLKVRLDSQSNPEALVYKNKDVYVCSDCEKEEIQKKQLSKKRKEIENKIPKTLLRSISPDILKLWINSPYTHPDISESLKNYQYFYDNPIVPVSWWGPFTDAGGYANMNREIVFRLHNYHIIAKADVCPTAPQISSMAHYYLSKCASFNFNHLRNNPRVWAFTPLPHSPHEGKNIFFTMMETESLHPEFVRLCNVHSDEIWVPSSHNYRVFREYGVKKPIKVMPLGIDDRLYSQENKAPLGTIKSTECFVDLLGRKAHDGVNSFRFVSLFGWSYRKGTDILIKSFVEEFGRDDDVALVIVARHSGSSEQSHINIIKSEVDKYAKSVRNSNYPQILLYPHIVPELQMPSIYRMGHVFIHTSRGEGFSLPQIEASASGLPVISCNNTGMGEYLTDDNAFLIKTDEKEICSPEMHWITAYYQNQLFAKLGGDQIHQARKHMRFTRENLDKAMTKGKNLTDLVFSEYTWEKASFRVAARIREIHQENK